MRQVNSAFNYQASIKKVINRFSAIFNNSNRIAVLSWTDIIIFIAAVFVARNDGVIGVIGVAPALWAALNLLKYKHRLVLILAMTVGIGSTGNSKALLSLWLFALGYLLLTLINRKGQTVINKSIIILVAVAGAYSFRIAGNFNLFKLASYTITTLLLTQIYYVALSGKLLQITKYSNNDWGLMCKIILLATAVSGIGPVSIGTLSVLNIAVNFSIMIMAASGSYPAALTGIVVGSNLLSGTFLPIQAGQACFTGFVLGISRSYSKLVFILTAVAANLLWLWQSSFSNIRIAMLEVLISLALWALVQRILPGQEYDGTKVDKIVSDRPKPEKDQGWDQIAKVCDEIAVVLGSGEYQPIENTHLQQIVEWTGVSLCQDCVNYYKCWSEDLFMTYHRWKALLQSMEQDHSEPAYIEHVLPAYCHRKEQLQSLFTNHLDLIRLELFWRNRLHECNSLAVERLNDFSDMARAIASGSTQKKELEKDLKQKITEVLRETGIKTKHLDLSCASYKRQVNIDMAACYDYKACSNLIIPALSQIIGGDLYNSKYKCSKHTRELNCSCQLEYRPVVKINYGAAGRTSNDISGDTYWIDSLADGRFIALLSDGMGSGTSARRESEYAIELLKKLLETGLDIKSLIKLLNTALALGIKKDSFVTIDGVIIDCFHQRAQLIKIGASYTCLKRGSNVKIWRSSTLPVGVFPEIDIDQFEIDLLPGDIIVMLSDGIVDNQRDLIDIEKWLSNLVRELPSRKPSETAEYILELADQHSKIEIKDDMTAIVIEVI